MRKKIRFIIGFWILYFAIRTLPECNIKDNLVLYLGNGALRNEIKKLFGTD